MQSNREHRHAHMHLILMLNFIFGLRLHKSNSKRITYAPLHSSCITVQNANLCLLLATIIKKVSPEWNDSTLTVMYVSHEVSPIRLRYISFHMLLPTLVTPLYSLAWYTAHIYLSQEWNKHDENLYENSGTEIVCGAHTTHTHTTPSRHFTSIRLQATVDVPSDDDFS